MEYVLETTITGILSIKWKLIAINLIQNSLNANKLTTIYAKYVKE